MKTKTDELIDEQLNDIKDELENANYHNQIELPQDIYNAIKHLIDEEDRLEFVTRLHDVFYENI